MIKRIKKNWKLCLLLAVAFLVIDGIKAYYIAEEASTKLHNKTCTSIFFLGVWYVSYEYNGAHEGCSVTYEVAPVLPVIIGKRLCK